VRINPSNVAILLTWIAALFFWWGPWREPELPDVVRRFSEMQVGQRLHYEVRFGHCFGGSRIEGWIAREADDWQQSVSYLASMSDGQVVGELEQQLSRDINFLGQLSASIYKLGPPKSDTRGWIDTFETIRLDWNEDGQWDQEWELSDRGSSVKNALLHGTDVEW
jgi:hypothetical protein